LMCRSEWKDGSWERKASTTATMMTSKARVHNLLGHHKRSGKKMQPMMWAIGHNREQVIVWFSCLDVRYEYCAIKCTECICNLLFQNSFFSLKMIETTAYWTTFWQRISYCLIFLT
jgi:hypothetical protein